MDISTAIFDPEPGRSAFTVERLTYNEIWDGTYIPDDLLDAAELIQVRRENEKRAAEAARG